MRPSRLVLLRLSAIALLLFAMAPVFAIGPSALMFYGGDLKALSEAEEAEKAAGDPGQRPGVGVCCPTAL